MRPTSTVIGDKNKQIFFFRDHGSARNKNVDDLLTYSQPFFERRIIEKKSKSGNSTSSDTLSCHFRFSLIIFWKNGSLCLLSDKWRVASSKQLMPDTISDANSFVKKNFWYSFQYSLSLCLFFYLFTRDTYHTRFPDAVLLGMTSFNARNWMEG